jgi:hypothetical protein
MGKPTTDVRGIHLSNVCNAALLLQIALQQSERGAVPFQGFLAMIAPFMVIQIVK